MEKEKKIAATLYELTLELSSNKRNESEDRFNPAQPKFSLFTRLKIIINRNFSFSSYMTL